MIANDADHVHTFRLREEKYIKNPAKHVEVFKNNIQRFLGSRIFEEAKTEI